MLVQTPESLAASLNLDVRTGHDVVSVDGEGRRLLVRTETGEESIDYDRLVLAPGAKAIQPDIAGLGQSSRVHTLRTVDDAIAIRGKVDSGVRRAVVLGAGFIGVEAAEGLAMNALETTLVELAPQVLPPLDAEQASLVESELKSMGIAVRTGVAATEIRSGAEADTVVLSDGSELVADVVVLSVGVRPDTAFLADSGLEMDGGALVVDEHGRTSLPDVFAVGDATVSTDAVTGVCRPGGACWPGQSRRAPRCGLCHEAGNRPPYPAPPRDRDCACRKPDCGHDGSEPAYFGRCRNFLPHASPAPCPTRRIFPRDQPDPPDGAHPSG